MTRETDAADSLGDSGSVKAERELCENFGMTVKRVREFDPQTLDVTRACKFLGLPPKRYDLLATQPEARDRWVESVALQKKVLIELFPEASRELKEMLEAIRKFATRKCLRPDGPAMLDGDGSGPPSKTHLATEVRRLKARTRLLVGGLAVTLLAVAGAAVAVLAATRGGPEPQTVALAGTDAKRGIVATGVVADTAPAKPASTSTSAQPAPVPVVPPDPFVVDSVWSDGDFAMKRTLTVTTRQGEGFTAKFVIGDAIEREVSGTVKAGQVTWLARDVRVVRGPNKGGDYAGTIRSGPGEHTIRFEWKDKEGAAKAFTLHGPTAKAPAAPPPPRSRPPASSPPPRP